MHPLTLKAKIKMLSRPVVWLTGLSGSGKSTLAQALHHELIQRGYASFVLDGDAVRTGLCRDLGFSAIDRAENIRRIAEVAKLFAQAGVIPIAAAISPYAIDREMARSLMPENGFLEIYVDTPLTTCEQRDPKGLYARARRGELPGFTGIDAPYEIPQKPELRIQTAHFSVQECIIKIISLLTKNLQFHKTSTQ